MYAAVRRYEGVTDPAEESISRAADFVRDNLASLLPGPPEVMAGEVVASA